MSDKLITLLDQPPLVVLRGAPLRRVYVILWTGLMTLLLLQSSAQPLIGPAAPPGPPDTLRELLMIAGHLVAFGGLVVLLWWALLPGTASPRALLVAVAFALVMSISTELLQGLVPDREPSLWDIATNAAAVLLAAWVICCRPAGSL
ncbi:MAG: VanZ family protein [Chloroflexota bacterium]